MSFGTLGLVALAVYLVALLVLAETARRARADLTPADHFLAGRGLGVTVLFFTIYATAYSGNSLLGYPGEAYRRGYSWIMATGFMMAIIVVLHLLVPRLRPLAAAEGFVTPGDWVRHRFGEERGGRALVVAVGLIMAIALTNFLLAQLTAMGIVTSQVTDRALPYWAGVGGLAALILLYETLGGMRAVAWTDVAQGALMLVGLGTLLAWLVGDAGGLAAATRRIAAIRPDAIAVPAAAECANWASSLVLMGLASVVYPQTVQRIYAARSDATLRRSLALMAFMPLATTTVVTLIGIAAIARFESLGPIEADSVMPRLLAEWAAAGPGRAFLAILVFIGALAAIMSTADSVLLSLGAVIAGDLLGRPRDAPATTKVGKRAAALLMVLAVAVALGPRVTLWRLIELKMELLIQCVPAFLLAIHWPGMRAAPTLAGLAAGTAIAVAGVMLDLPQLAGVHVGVLGLAVNLGVAVAGSRWAGTSAIEVAPETGSGRRLDLS